MSRNHSRLVTGSETSETPPAPPTYRELAHLHGCSTATVWRHANRGRQFTRTEVLRKERFALVCAWRFVKSWSIRRIAADLHISRSAVERDLRQARRLEQMGYEQVEIASWALQEARAARSLNTKDLEPSA